MNRRYEQVLRSMNRRLFVLRPRSRHRVLPRSLNHRRVLVPRSMNRRLLVLRSRGCCLVALCHLLRSLDMLPRVSRPECWRRSRYGSGLRTVMDYSHPLHLPLLRPRSKSLLKPLRMMVVLLLVSLHCCLD